jgi:hypothetical protein
MATALAAWCFLSYGQIKEKGTNNNLTIKFNDDLEDEFNILVQLRSQNNTKI